MKTVVIFFIRVYQVLFSRVISFIVGSPTICRFSPTCSKYSIQMIEKYGIIQGGWLSIKRIASCQPFIKLKAQNSKFKATRLAAKRAA